MSEKPRFEVGELLTFGPTLLTHRRFFLHLVITSSWLLAGTLLTSHVFWLANYLKSELSAPPPYKNFYWIIPLAAFACIILVGLLTRHRGALVGAAITLPVCAIVSYAAMGLISITVILWTLLFFGGAVALLLIESMKYYENAFRSLANLNSSCRREGFRQLKGELVSIAAFVNKMCLLVLTTAAAGYAARMLANKTAVKELWMAIILILLGILWCAPFYLTIARKSLIMAQLARNSLIQLQSESDHESD